LSNDRVGATAEFTTHLTRLCELDHIGSSDSKGPFRVESKRGAVAWVMRQRSAATRKRRLCTAHVINSRWWVKPTGTPFLAASLSGHHSRGRLDSVIIEETEETYLSFQISRSLLRRRGKALHAKGSRSLNQPRASMLMKRVTKDVHQLSGLSVASSLPAACHGFSSDLPSPNLLPRCEYR